MRAADAVRHWKTVQAVDCKPGHLEMRPKQMKKNAKPAKAPSGSPSKDHLQKENATNQPINQLSTYINHPTIRHQGNQQGLLASGKSSSVICKDSTVAKRCLEKYSFRLSLMTLRQKVCLPHPSPCHSNSSWLQRLQHVTTFQFWCPKKQMDQKMIRFYGLQAYSLGNLLLLIEELICSKPPLAATKEFQTVSPPPKAFGRSHQPSNLWGSFERPCLVASSVIICIPVSL